MPATSRVTVTRFLTEGQISDLHLGATEAEVTRRFGEPDARSSVASKPLTLRYGGLEVTVRDGAVVLLAIEFEGLDVYALDLEGLSQDTTRGEFEAFLRARGLSVDERIYEDPDGDALWRLGRTSVAFEGGRLQSIQISA